VESLSAAERKYRLEKKKKIRTTIVGQKGGAVGKAESQMQGRSTELDRGRKRRGTGAKVKHSLEGEGGCRIEIKPSVTIRIKTHCGARTNNQAWGRYEKGN